ncbi:hypothetical protein QQ045_007243 [Rhodiola kirilowii]
MVSLLAEWSTCLSSCSVAFACTMLCFTHVLQDNRFRWLTHVSVEPTPESTDPSDDPESKASQATSMHLYFPCGIIRGALSNLSIPCAVSADISNLPACSFVVRIKA